ncbi:hypothetical protein QWY28_14890 [Nocardioides sp. SOB77]|uniref:PASTA domain-containing protein n=1 Tax=Nocardioides oceani TaxID=3058369 RepID=A0ABT8FHU5_9ACTN|nr:hypothetical protein [Nocardioides oceani]MDN4174248.1 hypothetical protein [Nocardioides oceani]
MGGAIPLLIFLAIAVAVLYFLSTSGVVALGGRRAGGTRVADELPDERLRYAVPLGQDPSAVVAALTRQGYDAALDPDDEVDGRQVVHVARTDDERPDREDVRRVIREDATLNLEGHRPDTGPVRFADER